MLEKVYFLFKVLGRGRRETSADWQSAVARQVGTSLCIKNSRFASVLVATSIIITLVLAGCGTPRNAEQGSKASSRVDALVLLTAPAAVDVDSNSGPDGIAVRIFATSQTKPRALSLENGTLEVLMFDGVVNEQTPASAQPLHTWSHTIAELKPVATKTAIGVSYPLTLLWGKDHPQRDMITIAARYVGPDGRSIYSAPSTIPVGNPRPK